MSHERADLPEAYTRYFELRAAGLTTHQIAVELEIPLDAMDAFVQMAHSKRSRTASDEAT